MRPRVRIKTAVQLLHIFWPDFVEANGLIFLAWVTPHEVGDPKQGLDRTGTEALYNHTHMIDLFQHKAGRKPMRGDDDCFYSYQHPDFALLCEAGKKIARMWYEKLKIDFPQYRFRVHYTQEDNPIVRFHRVYPGEPYWLDENRYADDVKAGKVIVYDTGEPT